MLEEELSTYKRFSCPFCRKVVCTKKFEATIGSIWDKLDYHRKTCMKYQAALANGKIAPTDLCFQVSYYHIS